MADHQSLVHTLRATAMVVALTFVARPATAALPPFEAMHSYDAARYQSAQALAVGDLDGDGRIDLATAGSSETGDGVVAVLLGGPDGVFAPLPPRPVGSPAFAIAIGRLDADAVADLAITNAAGAVAFLRGRGDGTFDAPVEHVTGGGSATSVAIGDVDGDGRNDLAATNEGRVSVFLGRGDGTFGSPAHFEVGPQPVHVVMADLDADGDLDLAVGCVWWFRESSRGIAVLLGNGDGTFAPRVDVTHEMTGWLSVADVDHDGTLDLIAAGSSGVAVLRGSGGGTFAAPRTLASHRASASSVAVSDLNGDGALDFVATIGIDRPMISVGYGNGDGTSTSGPVYSTGQSPAGITVARLNDDAEPDLVLLDNLAGVSVLWGRGGGTFYAGRELTDLRSQHGRFGDVNHDGLLDLAALSADFSSGAARQEISVLLGRPDGEFSAPIASVLPGLAASLAIADLNGDHQLDVVATRTALTSDTPPDPNTVMVALGRGDGTLATAAEFLAGAYSRGVAIGDVNGDQVPDLAVSHPAVTSEMPHVAAGVSVLLGSGDGTFGAPRRFFAGNDPHAIAIADVNHDLDPDLIVVDHDSRGVFVLRGRGDGTFADGQNHVTGDWPQAVAVRDLNGDGNADIAVINHLSATLSLLPGDGSGSFGPRIDYPTLTGPSSMTFGDVDGDAILDLVVSCRSGVQLLRGGRNGTYTPSPFALGHDEVLAVTLADVDQDGTPDLYLHTKHQVLVHRNSGFVPVVIDSESHDPVPALAIAGVVPNPSRHETSIHFRLPREALVDAELYDVRGRRVRSLAAGARFAAGAHVLAMSRRGPEGAELPAGVYWVRVRAAGTSVIARAVVLE